MEKEIIKLVIKLEVKFEMKIVIKIEANLKIEMMTVTVALKTNVEMKINNKAGVVEEDIAGEGGGEDVEMKVERVMLEIQIEV